VASPLPMTTPADNTPTGVFRATDVDHMPCFRGDGGYWTWSLKSDPLTAVDGSHEFYYIGDRRRSLRPIPIRSYPLESATIQ